MFPRLAHTMIRVRDHEASLAFYVNALGMRVLRSTRYEQGRFTNTFVGYGSEVADAVIELTWNWDRAEPYEMGTAWGHLALEVEDVYGFAQGLRAQGVQVVREPGPMAGGSRVIAFIVDPDGYRIEIVQPIPSEAS